MTIVCEKKGKTSALSSVPSFDKMYVSLKITEGSLTVYFTPDFFTIQIIAFLAEGNVGVRHIITCLMVTIHK